MEEGHFRDGDKLPPERALAESFGVSRSSVREAIRALAEKGLLESRQGDGTYVRVPDIEPLKEAILEAVDSEGLMFDEVTEYRRIVEPGIAEIAAVRHTSEQLDRLKIIACDQQRRLLGGDIDIKVGIELITASTPRGAPRSCGTRRGASSRFPPTCASSTRLSGGPRKTAARPSKSISIRLSTNTFSPP